MSIWNDLFDIYTSVTSDEQPTQLPTPISGDSGDDQSQDAQQTVYVFAYLDDGKGNITRNIAVEDRITMLEAKNQELESRYNALIDELKKYEDTQTED